MRAFLIVSCVLLSGNALAQPTFGVSVGGSVGDCREVARQITRDWFEVKDVIGAGHDLKRPTASDFRCVAPESLQSAMPRRLAGSSLRCYSKSGLVACCDPNMQACATL